MQLLISIFFCFLRTEALVQSLKILLERFTRLGQLLPCSIKAVDTGLDGLFDVANDTFIYKVG